MIQEALWMLKCVVKKVYTQVSSWRNDIGAWRRFWNSYWHYKKIISKDEIPLLPLLRNLYPCIGEDTAETYIEPTYFYQDAWAFEKIFSQNPQHHVDIGSHHKFVALLSKVVSVTMVDIRPLSLPMDTINFKQGSILRLPFEDDSLESISSLCVVEHIGLGRYGDPLDPEGSAKAITELCRVLAPGGRLYLSVPIGNQSIVAFNAGRIFSLDDLIKLFKRLIILDQSFIVGTSLQKDYQHTGGFGTTGLFELVKNQGKM